MRGLPYFFLMAEALPGTRWESIPSRISLLLLFASLSVCSQYRACAQNAGASASKHGDDLALSTEAVGPRRFIAVHGKRSLIDGYASDGLEVWAYPLQLIRSYRISFLPQGASSEISGDLILRRLTYRPGSVERIYIGPDFVVREKLFVPIDSPQAILQYTVESRKPVDIIVHFVPVLNLMWPASIGGQELSWREEAHGYLLSEPTRRFAALIGSSSIVAHDEVFNRPESSSVQNSLAFTIRPSGDITRRSATVVVGAVRPQDISTETLVQSLTDQRRELEARASTYEEDLRSSELSIHTPDEVLNRDLAWSQTALDQAWVCNPDLGCGLVAGYGPSRAARRPQYAWFFAGDAMVAVKALLSEGQYDRARDALAFIARYQDPRSGMIWHEMSQSAGLLDWKTYPYMFVHVDISFQYLIAMNAYTISSGDTQFLKDHWASVQAAYHYCQSLIDPRDGLPRIPPDKEGGDEQNRMSDELTLSTSWVTAAQAFAEMARIAGQPQQGADAASAAARASIPRRYWNPKEGFWVDGYAPDGREVLNRSSRGNAALAQHVFPAAQEQQLLDQLASPDFQTDWGTRSNALTSRNFNPDSYATGSVWAVGTANLAEVFWAQHRPSTALPIWRSLIPWLSLDSLGHMDEVLAGNFFHEQMESVPEQTWSSAVFLHSAVQGMLGLKVDGMMRQIIFSPHLPPDWDTLNVDHIHLADASISLHWRRTHSGADLEIVNPGRPFHLLYSPEIPLGSRLTPSQWNDHRVDVRLEQHDQDTHATVDLDVPTGSSRLLIGYSGGISIRVPQQIPLLGNASCALKITKAGLHAYTFILDAQVSRCQAASFDLETGRKILNVQGATWQPVAEGRYAFTLLPTTAIDPSTGYGATRAIVRFAPVE